MTVLFSLIFEFVKIEILSCVYATVVFLIFKAISYYKPGSWFDNVFKKKVRLWFLNGFFASAGLFVFMFTYWGDHGLGDNERIPIGHWKQIQQVDGVYCYMQRTKNNYENQIDISIFTITANFICAKTEKQFQDYPGEYFVYNLKNNDVIFLKNESEYNTYANVNKLPLSNTFKDFDYHYNHYWNGWRFWLLP